ncbi:MAG: AMP-binding protein [Gemmatimonadaceae bacterium]
MTLMMPTSEDATTLDTFRARVVRHPDRLALEELAAGGARRDAQLTWREWHELSTRVARALIRDGVQRGDSVAILAGNRNLWPIAELGILMAGAVSVGVSGDDAQIAFEVGDCHAVAAIVDTTSNLQKLMAHRGELPALRIIVCEDGASNGARWWGEWLDDSMATDTPLPDAAPDDLALLVYGSSPSGERRAARITHRCITASTASAGKVLALGEQDCAVSVLPYSDAEERVLGLHLRIRCGMSVAHVADERTLWRAAGAIDATVLIGQASHYETLYQSLLAHERTLGNDDRGAWTSAITLGRERVALRRAGEPVPDPIEARWRIAMTPSRAARQLLGATLRVTTARGAPLAGEVADHLAAMGIVVRGGYGPVEHICATMQPPDDCARDSGAPMPGTELRIGDDRGVLVKRSALTFAGYHERPSATRDAFTSDGLWLRTGRRGELLPNGHLRLDASHQPAAGE